MVAGGVRRACRLILGWVIPSRVGALDPGAGVAVIAIAPIGPGIEVGGDGLACFIGGDGAALAVGISIVDIAPVVTGVVRDLAALAGEARALIAPLLTTGIGTAVAHEVTAGRAIGTTFGFIGFAGAIAIRPRGLVVEAAESVAIRTGRGVSCITGGVTVRIRKHFACITQAIAVPAVGRILVVADTVAVRAGRVIDLITRLVAVRIVLPGPMG